MIERTIFREEHHIFRESVRRFVDREIVPFHAQWEKDGIVPRELWLKAGAEGLLCCTVPEEYGGMGLDYLFDVVVFEELWRSGASGPGFLIHTDLVATYLLSFGTEAQKRQWLPKMVSGEAIGSLGMTEPHAGSDLKAIRTRAVRDGDDFVINGQKVFISNGQLCDFVVLATKTDGSAGAKGVTLFIVESNRPGFQRGRNLEKIGMKAQDTSELFFENIRIPATNMLGAGRQGLCADDDEAVAGTARPGDPLRHRHRNGDGLDRRIHVGPQCVRPEARQLPEHPVQARRSQDQGDGRPRLHRSMHFALHGGKARSGRRRDGQDVHLRASLRSGR